MTTIDQIIQELEQLPEPLLEELLNFVRSLKIKQRQEQKTNNKAFLAYLESEEKWSEAYRRLANS